MSNIWIRIIDGVNNKHHFRGVATSYDKFNNSIFSFDFSNFKKDVGASLIKIWIKKSIIETVGLFKESYPINQSKYQWFTTNLLLKIHNYLRNVSGPISFIPYFINYR